MSRISKTDVNKALELAGKRIVEAGGADKRVSRADVQKALGSLDGTEKKLVDIFFKFMDHRDFKTGAQVTATDVQRAIAYAKEHMVAKYDLNGNGLSETEIAKMSLTGKLAVELAKSLKSAVVEPQPSAAVLQEGLSFYELRQQVKVTSEQRLTSSRNVDPTLQAQLITACHQSSYTDVRTLADAFAAVDGGEFVIRKFADAGKQYIAIDFGAGDSTYGAIFEAGKTAPAFAIHDGELMKP